MRVRRQSTYVRVEAPAKLNLFFEVLGTRGDGFHEIETLMVPINLYDSLTFTPLLPTATPRLEASASAALRWSGGVPPDSSSAARSPLVDGVALDCCWAGTTDPTTALGTLPPPSENLVTRAAILLRRRAGVAAGATIRLVKRIPSAAGLGGGSSDAAATLLAGNLAWGIGWPLAHLAELAAELGSDVPFFLTSRAAICRGRGERVEPLACPSRVHAVVVRPPAGLSTAQVYGRCQLDSLPHSVQPAARRVRKAACGNWGERFTTVWKNRPPNCRLGSAGSEKNCRIAAAWRRR